MVPVASPTSTTSPTPYWSSKIMKSPERKSLTSDWAPKPSAMPMMPALAMIGAMLTPTSLSIMVAKTAISTIVITLFRTLPMVIARCARRAETAGLTRSGSTPCSARRISRSTTLWSSHRTIRPRTSSPSSASGTPMKTSDPSDRVSFPVTS